MDEWRFIIDQPQSGPHNMAIDYALLKSVAHGSPPVLRVYRWSPPAVSIGYFQVVDEEIDAAACRADSVPVIRRITGGGAVFHDHELTYSVCIPLGRGHVPGRILDSYERICTPVIAALSSIGIAAHFRPVNDLCVGDRKISGNAQTRRDGVLLQHGTLLLSADPARMARYLKITAVKWGGAGMRERITSLAELGVAGTDDDAFIESFARSLAAAMAQTFGVTFIESSLNDEESMESDIIEQAFFGNESWNCRRKK